MPQAHGDIIKQWLQHAEAQLPRQSSRFWFGIMISNYSLDFKSLPVYQFELDGESGRPLLPLLDLADPNLALGQISEILTRYLAALWGTSSPVLLHFRLLILNSLPHLPSIVLDNGYPAENAMPTIPWAALAQDPAGHYDVRVFTLPSLIGNPVPCRPVDAPGLYEVIARYQVAGTPFRFFTKAEYLSRAKDAAQRIIEEAETGEEADNEEPDRTEVCRLSFCIYLSLKLPLAYRKTR